MISAPKDNAVHMEIVRLASPHLRVMKTGDISPVIDAPNGALLVEMVKRMPAVMDKFAENKETIRREIMENKSQQLQSEFMIFLDRNCRYELEDQNPEK